MKRIHLITIFIVSLTVFVGLKKVTYDNETFLVNVAEFSDVPSRTYYFAVDRIFELAQERKIENKFAQYVLDGKKENLHEEFIHLAGVIGKRDSVEFLMMPFVKSQRDPNRKALQYFTIASMGSTGNENFLPILETLLKNYDQHELNVPKYCLIRSLYLITGENYESRNSKELVFVVTPELERVRLAIVGSKGRRRTFEEMVVIDSVNRPTDWGN